MILLIGPFVAGVGLVAVFFVFRHKAVQKQSLYSSRRTQIERKVRAARQRTLAPSRRKEEAEPEPAAEVAPPDATVVSPPGQPVRQWDRSPTAPAPAAEPAYSPPPVQAEPAYTPPAPVEPAYTPPPEPAYTPPPADEPVWTPGPAPSEPAAPAATAPGGSSWSVVEGDKQVEAPAASAEKSEKKGAAHKEAGWSLDSGEKPDPLMPAEEHRGAGQVLAIAQYLVFVVGLIMVLVGVLVMVANSKIA